MADEGTELKGETEERDEVDKSQEPEDQEAREPVVRKILLAQRRFGWSR